MIYVVTGEWVDYECSEKWIVKAFTSRERADEFAIACTSEGDGLRAQYQAIYNQYKEHVLEYKRPIGFPPSPEWLEKSKEYNARMEACIGELDNHFHAGYGDLTTYEVVEVEVEG